MVKELKYIIMTNIEKRKRKINAIGEISMAGFEFIERHEWGEPMLMGGYEYIARRGKYVLAYNIKDKNICLQKNDFNSIDWKADFIIKWKHLNKIEDLGDTIKTVLGIEFYKTTK